MLAIAAEQADIIGLQTVSTATGAATQDPRLRMAETMRQKVERLRQLAGERFEKIELSTVVSIAITDNRREAAEEFARGRGWDGISADQVLAKPSVFIGSVDTIVAEMRERRQAYGLSYYVVHDRAMRDLAPVVSRLAGR